VVRLAETKLLPVIKEPAMYPKILVPLDGSDTAGQGLQEAIVLVRRPEGIP